VLLLLWVQVNAASSFIMRHVHLSSENTQQISIKFVVGICIKIYMGLVSVYADPI